jgi:hypothetical protein
LSLSDDQAAAANLIFVLFRTILSGSTISLRNGTKNCQQDAQGLEAGQ